VTVESIYWPGIADRDLHLLPGLTSPRLDHLLAIGDSAGNVRGDNPPTGVTVTFAAQLAVPPATVGVPVDPGTGEITVLSPLLPATATAPRLRSFVVDATVTDPVVATPFTASLRVFVHERLVDLWLSPSTLTVRQGAKNMRYSVLAKFDDGTIGDVTNWAPFEPLDPGRPDDRTYVHATRSGDPELFWSATHGGPIGVDPNTGVLEANAPLGGITVNASPRSFPGQGGDAAARCAPPWSTGLQLSPVAGPGFDAMGDPDVRNVLFLPDGFQDTDADRDAFDRFVRVIVGRLSARRRTRPWDLLRGKINYFSGFLSSPDAGVSVLDELDRGDPPSKAEPMEQPTRPDPAAAVWELPELLYEVGPPTPAHDPAGKTLASRLPDWDVLYGTPAAVTTGLAGAAFPAWLACNDRVLLNERDTAFHTAMGHRPGLTVGGTNRDLQFHPLRTHVDDFEAFLGALEDEGGTRVVGETWTKHHKDDDLVVILCRTTRDAGSNDPRTHLPEDGHYVCVSLSNELAHELESARRGSGFDVKVAAVPARVIPDTWTTIAHELAHSLSLIDEYGERPGPLDLDTINDLATRANAQTRSSLLGAGGLETALLKWGRWPRIANAGVLAANPAPAAGGNFTLTLQPGHARVFRDGDIVRLRKRPLVAAVGHSDQLTVHGDPAGDTLTLMPRVGSVLNPATFPAGSIVMVPLRAPDQGAVLGDDLALAARRVLDRIEATDNPLNASHRDAIGRPCPGPAPSPPRAYNFPGGVAPKPPRFSSWIVGVWEGAADYACDVYRPTGVCIMREYQYVPKSGRRQRAAEFCPVCRYAMVDLLDPTQHGRIDRDYAPRYPA
jgi:hypothetical protein